MSVLQPTGWWKRQLVTEEEWMVYDCPHRFTTLLRERSGAAVDCDFRELVPGRWLDTGVRHFMSSLGIRAEGGG
jgi:hypothetical protein